jgi:hypothetical protein
VIDRYLASEQRSDTSPSESSRHDAERLRRRARLVTRAYREFGADRGPRGKRWRACSRHVVRISPQLLAAIRHGIPARRSSPSTASTRSAGDREFNRPPRTASRGARGQRELLEEISRTGEAGLYDRAVALPEEVKLAQESGRSRSGEHHLGDGHIIVDRMALEEGFGG